MKNAIIRYAQEYKDKPSEVKIELGFTSPRAFHQERDKHFSFPPRTYEIDIEYEIQIGDDEGLTNAIKRIFAKLFEITGEHHHFTDLFWVHDDGTMPNCPRSAGYLLDAAWPMKGETNEEADKRANEATIERSKRVLESFMIIFGQKQND